MPHSFAILLVKSEEEEQCNQIWNIMCVDTLIWLDLIALSGLEFSFVIGILCEENFLYSYSNIYYITESNEFLALSNKQMNTNFEWQIWEKGIGTTRRKRNNWVSENFSSLSTWNFSIENWMLTVNKWRWNDGIVILSTCWAGICVCKLTKVSEFISMLQKKIWDFVALCVYWHFTNWCLKSLHFYIRFGNECCVIEWHTLVVLCAK